MQLTQPPKEEVVRGVRWRRSAVVKVSYIGKRHWEVTMHNIYWRGG